MAASSQVAFFELAGRVKWIHTNPQQAPAAAEGNHQSLQQRLSFQSALCAEGLPIVLANAERARGGRAAEEPQHTQVVVVREALRQALLEAVYLFPGPRHQVPDALPQRHCGDADVVRSQAASG